MRIASFRHADVATWGAVTPRGLVDLGARHRSLRDALEAGAVEALLAGVTDASPTVALEDVTLLPVVPRPDKILCVGVNYHAHRVETGRAPAERPTLFTRFANTLVAHGAPLVRPRASTELDFEGEMAVVIGRGGRHIPRERALEHVLGWTCFNDATVRDWQRHASQFTPGKNFVATAGLGPWVVTRDELPDPAALEVSLRLNGQEMQRATTDLLIFDVPYLVEYISTFTELAPGDILATGTPGGVGWKRTPPVFMKHGDIVEVEVRGVGVLRNVVEDEPAAD